jgi:hypothetical protein
MKGSGQLKEYNVGISTKYQASKQVKKTESKWKRKSERSSNRQGLRSLKRLVAVEKGGGWEAERNVLLQLRNDFGHAEGFDAICRVRILPVLAFCAFVLSLPLQHLHSSRPDDGAPHCQDPSNVVTPDAADAQLHFCIQGRPMPFI